jgi:tetratricopeptide (TPR) repeat protein
MPFKIRNFFSLKKPKESTNNIKSNTNAEVWVIKGENYANRNNLKEAIKCFDIAFNLDRKNDFALGDKALMLDKLKKYDEALNTFSQALEINPNNPITWHNKGLTFARLNKLEDSIYCFNKALGLKQDYAKAWYNKGRCLEKLGELENSQKCLTMAKKIDPFLFTKIKR